MVMGVKSNDYDATYKTTAFDVIPRNGLFEIREIDSGLTFFIDKGAFDDKEGSKTGTRTIKRHGERYKVG